VQNKQRIAARQPDAWAQLRQRKHAQSTKARTIAAELRVHAQPCSQKPKWGTPPIRVCCDIGLTFLAPDDQGKPGDGRPGHGKHGSCQKRRGHCLVHFSFSYRHSIHISAI
jgi:hypothetical protein